MNGTDLTTRDADAGAMTLLGVPSDQLVAAATRIATDLKQIIDDQQLYTDIPQHEKIDGQWVDAEPKPFVHLEGWQTLGSLVGITAVISRDDPPVEIVRRDMQTGNPKVVGYRVYAEAKTLDGKVVGAAWAECTSDETRGPWARSTSQARLGMAQTRAMSRALKGPLGWVMKLAGYSPTPAEEMDVVKVLDGTMDATPEWGDDPQLAEDLSKAARTARAMDRLAWSDAKITARLADATEEERRELLDELTEWIDARAEGGKF